MEKMPPTSQTLMHLLQSLSSGSEYTSISIFSHLLASAKPHYFNWITICLLTPSLSVQAIFNATLFPSILNVAICFKLQTLLLPPLTLRPKISQPFSYLCVSRPWLASCLPARAMCVATDQALSVCNADHTSCLTASSCVYTAGSNQTGNLLKNIFKTAYFDQNC